jgi:hypothetical protein
MQDMLVDPVAQAAIALAFSGALILYALAGHNKQAGRLVGSGIGGCIALAIIHLLNYVLPSLDSKQFKFRNSWSFK